MISTHILDTQKGLPAQGVEASLYIKKEGKWEPLFTSKTNDDGRIQFECEYLSGQYMISFDIASYFQSHDTEYFFTEAPIIFKIDDTNRKYHVPILLNSYGYTTYRGS